MSFGRNLQTLFGTSSLWRGLGPDRPLYSVTLNDAKDTVTFTFQDGGTVRYQVEGDCCSHSWIEHLEVPNEVNYRTLVSVEDVPMESEDVERDGWEVIQSYRTVFRLDNGEAVTLEYRNSSNGYYGGYLVRLDSKGDVDNGDDA
jgi:hypothetical protein